MSAAAAAPAKAGAFTLLEVMLAMLVVTILLSGLAVPLAAQLEQRRTALARERLDEAREALLGFATAHGRLPCPATADSRGEERFAPGSDAADGGCADFHGGFLPAATLGLSPLDAEGFAPDGWDGRGHRVRYAVFGDGHRVNGVANPFTRANGAQQATLAALADTRTFLVVCNRGDAATATGCGTADRQLTRRAVFVVLSAGANAARTPAPGTDEARNVDGDAVFVSRDPATGGAEAFDDLVTWAPLAILASRLVAAGRLP